MLEYMVVPIEWKADDGGDVNTLVGYASTFGNVDLGGDVVMKGAFLKTIENIKANGIPLLADHIASTASVLGTIYDGAEDSKGLMIKARISSAPSAQDTAVKLREGHLSKMSIGYETMDDAYEDRDGGKVRLLKELKLWETSVVVFPMNPEATISRVKARLSTLEPDERKLLFERLAEAERELKDNDSSAQGEPSGQEAQGEPNAPASQVDDKTGTPLAGDEPASASDEGASGYDRFASRAILAGRPLVEVDPVTRASLETRLQLAERQLPPPEKE